MGNQPNYMLEAADLDLYEDRVMSWRARLVHSFVVFDLACKPLVVIQQVKRIAP